MLKQTFPLAIDTAAPPSFPLMSVWDAVKSLLTTWPLTSDSCLKCMGAHIMRRTDMERGGWMRDRANVGGEDRKGHNGKCRKRSESCYTNAFLAKSVSQIRLLSSPLLFPPSPLSHPGQQAANWRIYYWLARTPFPISLYYYLVQAASSVLKPVLWVSIHPLFFIFQYISFALNAQCVLIDCRCVQNFWKHADLPQQEGKNLRIICACVGDGKGVETHRKPLWWTAV